MMSLYSKEEAELYRKKANKSLILSILFFLLFVSAFASVIVLSTYDWKLFWMIFGSFFCLVPFALSFLFLLQRKHRLDALYIYRQILDQEGEGKVGLYRGISSNPITLPNGFEVYELEVEIEGESRKYYVSASKKDGLTLESDRSYRFRIVSNFVKGYEDA